MEQLWPDDPRAMGGYRLLGRLGAGGMGQVYLGRSSGGRMVAVKLVHAELARDPLFRQRFRREVEAARRVGDRWTAPVLDADTESGTPWVATGYVPGPTLADTVEQHGPLPEASVLALASGLVRALQGVHACGLIHRDLKPSNVLVTIDGPRVIDFGIAWSVDASVATRTGALIGSPAFMSPEQARGEELSPASDIFSLGSVLAHAATGRRPFGEGLSGLHAVLFQVMQGDPQLGELSGPVRGLVESCLARAPQDRPSLDAILSSLPPFPDAWLPAAVVTELGRHAAGLLDLETPDLQAASGPPPRQPSGLASTDGKVGTHTISDRRRRTSRKWLVPVAGAAAVAVLTAASVMAFTGDGAGDEAGSPSGQDAKGVVPTAMLGTWEGEIESRDSWQWRRITLAQGELDQDVAKIMVARQGLLCEYVGKLASSSPAVALRARLTRSIPAGKCENDPPQTLTLKDGQVHWAAEKVTGPLERARHNAVPAALQGRWVGTDEFARRRQFLISGGAVGTEAVRAKLLNPSGGVVCDTLGVLVSADGPIIFLATRLLTQSSMCGLNPELQAFKQEGQGLVWGFGDGNTGNEARLQLS
ncbi:serine/threonine-protein kinase [Actinomadura sp. LOL_016]|uniref:serine/threonine-protein kinase n=1 Tax=unclassified Actinomadura TaxID=2626254 RepID=UPI003A804194